MQNSIKLSEAIHELSYWQRKKNKKKTKNLAMMLKTILPSLPRSVISKSSRRKTRSDFIKIWCQR